MKSNRVADGAHAPSALLASSGPSQLSADAAGPADPANPANPEDQDVGDIPAGVDEDELDRDEMDTDQVASRE